MGLATPPSPIQLPRTAIDTRWSRLSGDSVEERACHSPGREGWLAFPHGAAKGALVLRDGARRKASVARSPARRRRGNSPTSTLTQRPADGADQPKEFALASSLRRPRLRLAARPHQRPVPRRTSGRNLVPVAGVHAGVNLLVEKSDGDLLISSVAGALLLR
jgi:hypothetical protein